MESSLAGLAVASLSIAALLGSLAVLAFTAQELHARWLVVARPGLIAIEASLLALTLGGPGPWTAAVDAVGMLLAILALALAFAAPRPLSDWARQESHQLRPSERCDGSCCGRRRRATLPRPRPDAWNRG
jgi:hypothetical protein